MLKLSGENKILYGGPELPILGNGQYSLGEVLLKKLSKSNDWIPIVIIHCCKMKIGINNNC